jgi:helicase SWR1
MAKKKGKTSQSPPSTASSSRGKRTSTSNDSHHGGDSKRRKGPNHGQNDDKAERLAKILVNFNMCVNELYQLHEYKTIYNWNPRDFSRASNSQIPELYENFLKNTRYMIPWDESELEKHDDIPLRLQKKVIAEQEQRILEKYPFKPQVIDESKLLEQNLIDSLELSTTPVPVAKVTKVSKVSNNKRHPSQTTKSTSTPVIPENQIETHYKLKSVKYSLNPPLVTHPSHIPTWRPEYTAENAMSGSNGEIIPFEPDIISVVKTKKDMIILPDIQQKIRTYITNHYKSAIIDESTMPDYNSSVEEYEKITSQQEELFKNLTQKVNENVFELKGDKIEKRKIVLPQTTTLRHASDPLRVNGNVVPKIQGAPNNHTYVDHFLEQAVNFSRLHQSMRKQHQAKTRKVAQMIESHFKKKAGEKERLAREQEQNLRRISRLAMQAVKKRWAQANKVYTFMQQEKEEELKKIKGREHLSQMLEHSTLLLEAQLNRSSRDVTEAETTDQVDGSDSDDEAENNDSENFSSSDESEAEDNHEKIAENEDLTMSVDELRRKYAKIESSDQDINSTVNETNDEADDSELTNTINVSSQSSENPENLETNPPQKLSLSALLGGAIDDNEAEDSGVELYESDDDEDMSSSDDENMTTTDEEDEPETPAPEQNGVVKPKGHDENDERNEVEINGTMVKDVPLPSLLRGTLRPYQKQGLNWLASLYNNSTNGILADEMGLGKTIQTISLLSYLACEHHVWGPHLIVVPTSVMLNWEMEFKKFAPGFKVLTYYGSPQQRAQKRKGWNKPDAFHVCITSYQLVVHDHLSFKRRRWKYMILDEAHNIKNFRSTRWKALLNFNTENRLLLTGTPLQNNLMELWSLLYFLMPSSRATQAMPEGFANLEDFQQWFGKPVDKILEQTTMAGGSDVIDENEKTTQNMDAETKHTVSRLHQVLRPYILRRLKKDVEKQMPGKYEHIVYCRLSKRQRFLYDDFMTRAKTKETLLSGNFLSIINCLMQLRKVCNHPDLFEVRPVVTSYVLPKSVAQSFKPLEDIVRRKLYDDNIINKINYSVLNLDLVSTSELNYFVAKSTNELKSSAQLEDQIKKLEKLIASESDMHKLDVNNCLNYHRYMRLMDQIEANEKLKHVQYLNTLRCERSPIYGDSLLKKLKIVKNLQLEVATDLVRNVSEQAEYMGDIIEKFSVTTPVVVALDMKDQLIPISTQSKIMEKVFSNKIENPFHKAQVKLSVAFPDKQLLQYDCGKLQKLATLLQQLTSEGHRALIFTQMTKVLDILEQFLNIHGYRYMRLDGATKIEDRQLLTEKFNRDNKIPVFILSTRSGGLGINLTGADTVIFYDSDWNPAMDKQCQDRCHRIGQTRDVHIYRFVSEYTIESNILKKANQKRQLDNVVIQEGDFTTDYFSKFSVRDLVNDTSIASDIPDKPLEIEGNVNNVLAQAEDEEDRAAASEAMKEVAIDDEDFNEDSKPDGSASATPNPEAGPKGSATDGDEYLDVDYNEGVGHIDEYMIRFISSGLL